ncbi:MAG: ComEC/Rec2 family competence protein [Planctomycetota bacterium]
MACDALAEPSIPVLCGLAGLVLAAMPVGLVLRRWVALSPEARGTAATRLAQLSGTLCGLAVALAGGMLVHALRARLPAPDDVSRLTPAQPVFVMLRGTVVGVSRSRAPGVPDTWTIAVESLGAEETLLRRACGRVSLKAPRSVAAGECVAGDAGAGPAAGRRDAGAPSAQGAVGEGDIVELRARLDPLPELCVPDGFDYGAHLQRQGIRRVGAVFPGSVRPAGGTRWWRVDLMLRRCSAALAQRIEAHLPQTAAAGRSAGSQAALLNALVLGRRERLDAGDREAFALAGTAHLLAISGLQIHFLSVALWWLSRLAGMKRRAAAWLVLLFCCAYCALAGANPPVVRATVMITLYVGALLCRREPDSLSILGAAALLILFFSPDELFSVGFQLSFLAVLALLTLCPVLNDLWCSRAAAVGGGGAAVPGGTGTGASTTLGWLSQFARRALFVSLAAWVGTAPVVAWHMGRFATLSLLVNLVAVPLSSVCMLAGLALLFLSAVCSALAGWAAWVAWAGIALLQWVNASATALPGSSIDVPRPAVFVLLLYATLWAWVWVERGLRATPWRVAGALALCLLVFPAGAFFPKEPVRPSVTVLDLWRGRAALAETAAGAVLIDCGAESDGFDVAEFLRRRGTARLELLVLSADEPDALGGARELFRRLAVARVVFPRAKRASPARRELEQFLARRGTPYGTPWDSFGPDVPGPAGAPAAARPEAAIVSTAVAGLHLGFCDDGALPGRPATVDSSLCVRVEAAGVALLFASARSSAALQRLLAKAGRTGPGRTEEDFLRADILRLNCGVGERWPPETRALMAQTGCAVIIAGQSSDPEEAAGLDLVELAKSAGAVLLSPHREGTLRVALARSQEQRYALEAFRNGAWRVAGGGGDF